jgi:hypothetical protein
MLNGHLRLERGSGKALEFGSIKEGGRQTRELFWSLIMRRSVRKDRYWLILLGGREERRAPNHALRPQTRGPKNPALFRRSIVGTRTQAGRAGGKA